jgi:hypothetical protein
MKSAKMIWIQSAIYVAIAFVLLLALPASAQSGAPVPFGNWATKPATEQLSVTPSWCRFTANNGASIVLLQEGTCSWDPTSAGGILTIINVHFYQPAPVRYSIVWVNAKTIKLDGDVMYKQN